MECIVNRSELLADGSSIGSSPDRDAVEQLKDLDDFRFINLDTDKGANHQKVEAEDEELDFRLFAAPKHAATSSEEKGAQKIRLRSPTVDTRNAGFIQPERNSNYYFSKPFSSSETESLKASALTSQQIFKQSQSYWPGSAYKWKVIQLPFSNLDKSLQIQQQASIFRKVVDDERPSKRTRPGKKYRIKLRTKLATVQKEKQAKKADAVAKEAAEREKRTRRNREKKAKKRLRDKVKIANVTAASNQPDHAVDD